ncbi:MAG: hypothetical protein M1833_007251 [Piccolia ochrophora]|nr:MAG: hypothetical protein M1833_007251 [Piccolia ochrophora]
MTRVDAPIVVGVLALQGAFAEHVQLLHNAARSLTSKGDAGPGWRFVEVRTPEQLSHCDALIIPGGESTTMSLVAARSNLLEPLREFVKVLRQPVWGTCAGLILLAESANRTKHGGQELIGGLDVRVNRNHFGRQVESFEANLTLPFLSSAPQSDPSTDQAPFKGVFIRAPVVEKILPAMEGVQREEEQKEATVVAPSKVAKEALEKEAVLGEVQVLATLPGRAAALLNKVASSHTEENAGDIIAVRQGNVFGTSFHPELTGDSRIHVWWLEQVQKAVMMRRKAVTSGLCS